MAELEHSLVEPILFTNILNNKLDPSELPHGNNVKVPMQAVYCETPVTSSGSVVRVIGVSDEPDSDSDCNEEEMIAAIESSKLESKNIDNMYYSLSQILQSLNMDVALVSKQSSGVKASYETDREKVVENIDKLKMSMELIQKQLLETRTVLIRMMTNNVEKIKSDIENIRNETKNNLRNIVKQIVAEEMTNMPSIESKFAELAREQRSALSHYIRKSSIQKGSDELLQIKAQQNEFLNKAEELLNKINKKMLLNVN